MIVLLLGIVVIGLGVLFLVQHLRYKHRSKQLLAIHEKVNAIREAGTMEKVLLFTADAELRLILVDLNRLIEDSHKTHAKQMNLESSMRRMLSNISHDLKTPLTVILGSLETMINDPRLMEEERELLLRRVYGKSNEVLELILKFFDLARLESGDTDLPMSPVDLGEVCRMRVLAYYDVLTAQGFKVQLDIPEEPMMVLSNVEALDRILNNLISNAIRYGIDGGVMGLHLSTVDDFFHLAIWDKGKGIAEVHQNKVFERMYTLEDSRNRFYQGSGLGLTITKRLTEQLNGRITLSSAPGIKTVFTLIFPKLRS
ncbi:signal transduction histidine kinase [Paenibacillus shirakamiensis]|uniref:histidine kinase n=1 Tax=Paenibacillus shirakamiensis TaxID=1265935 RepID=A0ABS4JIY3_9BACL|nr:sensor histidine kinase [Paenibacillus shirakamiensis]MBP2001666.1 signal transduction histidine kinase [Paenibacillus shirakamiensis]